MNQLSLMPALFIIYLIKLYAHNNVFKSVNCVLFDAVNKAITFAIKGTKLNVLFVTLSTQDIAKLLLLMILCLKSSITKNKY